MIVNVALLPPAEVAVTLEYASGMLGNRASNGALLGEGAIPHVTIAQIALADDKFAQLIIDRTRDLAPPPQLTLAGLCLLRGPDLDIWVESPVLKSARLAALQAETLDRVAEYGEVVSASGDGYRPHATLGYFSSVTDLDLGGVVRSLGADLRSTSVGWTLAVGYSGANYTFVGRADGS